MKILAIVLLVLVAGCSQNPDPGKRLATKRDVWEVSDKVDGLAVSVHRIQERMNGINVVDREPEYVEPSKGAVCLEVKCDVCGGSCVGPGRIGSDPIPCFKCLGRGRIKLEQLGGPTQVLPEPGKE